MNRNTNRLTQMSLCTLFFVCTACQSNESQEADNVEGSDKKSQAVSEIERHVRPVEISMDQQIKGAITDLATRIKVAEDIINVREARSVQWGSGAMGCPKPGMNYTQAIVPGVRLLREVNETIYHYHGGTGKSLFYCPAERATAPAFGQGEEVM